MSRAAHHGRALMLHVTGAELPRGLAPPRMRRVQPQAGRSEPPHACYSAPCAPPAQKRLARRRAVRAAISTRSRGSTPRGQNLPPQRPRARGALHKRPPNRRRNLSSAWRRRAKTRQRRSRPSSTATRALTHSATRRSWSARTRGACQCRGASMRARLAAARHAPSTRGRIEGAPRTPPRAAQMLRRLRTLRPRATLGPRSAQAGGASPLVETAGEPPCGLRPLQSHMLRPREDGPEQPRERRLAPRAPPTGVGCYSSRRCRRATHTRRAWRGGAHLGRHGSRASSRAPLASVAHAPSAGVRGSAATRALSRAQHALCRRRIRRPSSSTAARAARRHMLASAQAETAAEPLHGLAPLRPRAAQPRADRSGRCRVATARSHRL